MWIPRFAINENGEIQYIKNIESSEEGFEIPELFAYRQASETAPDFLLTGAWVAIDIDENISTTIAQMNQEESIYGFIANTIAVANDQTNQNEIQKYIENTVGAPLVGIPEGSDTAVPLTLDDISNPNRIILKIINQNNQTLIKAKGKYNQNTELIEIRVTYSRYGINKIVFEDAQELTLTKDNDGVITNSKGIELEDGRTYKIAIIDNKGNSKILNIKVIYPKTVTFNANGGTVSPTSITNYDGTSITLPTPKKSGFAFAGWYEDSNLTKKAGNAGNSYTPTKDITLYAKWAVVYAKLYGDGTLALTATDRTTSSANVIKDFGNIVETANPFRSYSSQIKTVNIVDKICPVTTSQWFKECTNLTTINNMSNFDTSNVTNMYEMFRKCSGLTSLDLSSFDTSNVKNMDYMFCQCSGLMSLDLSSFDTSNVKNMSNMFENCSSLTSLDLSSFDTSNVTNMMYMFGHCSGLTSLDLTPLDTSNVTNMSSMFTYCSGLTSIDLSPLDTSNVTNMGWMFGNCSGLTSLDLTPLDTSNVTDMYYMFTYCSGLTSIDLTPLDTSNVTNMYGMFYNCSSLTNIDLTPLDTRKVTDMMYMFGNCSGLTSLDLTPLDTSNVTNMMYMFANCSGLTSLDLTPLKTENVTDMSLMFYNCSSLTNIDLTPLDTSNVTNMGYMFGNCSGLTSLDLTPLDTSKVTDMSWMFYSCSSLTNIDLSSFDTSKVTNMSWMFAYSNNLKTIYVGENWITSQANLSSMFTNCGTTSVTKR